MKPPVISSAALHALLGHNGCRRTPCQVSLLPHLHDSADGALQPTLGGAAQALREPDEADEHAYTRSLEVLSALWGNAVVSCDFSFSVAELIVLK